MKKKAMSHHGEIDLLENRLKVLKEISTISSAKANTERATSKMLGTIMDAAIKIAGADAGSLLLVDETTNMLEFKIAKGRKAKSVKKFRLKMGEGIAGWVAKTGRSLCVSDAVKDKRFFHHISEKIKYPTKSICCVPLKINKKVIGVIEVINKIPKGSFSERDIDRLKPLAEEAAIVLSNVRIFNELKQSIEERNTLLEVSRIINSTRELHDLLDLIMELAKTVMKTEGSSLMLVDENTGELVFEIARGDKGEKVKEIRLKPGEGIAGTVAMTGKAVVVKDALHDDRVAHRFDEHSGFTTKNMICVPLKMKDRIIGIVEALNKTDRETFVESDVPLFEALASQAAVAIENAKLYEEMQELFRSTVRSLAEAIEAKDFYTRGHSERITKYSLIIADEIGLSEEAKRDLELAAVLHDVGKIGVHEEILNKPDKLTDDEWEQIKRHPLIGAEIMSPVKMMDKIIPGMKFHHERYDGNGYPEKLTGDKIPLMAKIICVADTFDAITSKRPYRKELSFEEAIREIRRCSGTQFDPDIVEPFVRAYEKGRISRL